MIILGKSYVKYDESWGAEPIPEIPKIAIHELFGKTVAENLDKTAVIFYGKEYSFNEIWELSSKLADAFEKLGVNKGDRIGTLLPNSIQQILAYFAVSRLGAIMVPMNVMYKERELSYLISDSTPKIMVVWDLLYQLIKPLKSKLGIEHVIVTNLKEFAGKREMSAPFNIPKTEISDALGLKKLIDNASLFNKKVSIDAENDLQMILYTAGTTGWPKGVMLTHYNFVSGILITVATLGIRSDDVNLVLFPMFHISGYMMLLLPTLYKGGKIVLSCKFDAGEYLDLMETYKVTTFVAPATVYIGFMNHPSFNKRDLSSLRMVSNGGMPISYELQKKWYEATRVELLNGYGLTETVAAVTASLPNKKNIKSIGVVMGHEAKIVDENGETVPIGEIGELLLRGPQIMKGYWNKPDETEKVFTEDGWFRTGDAAYMDKDGFIYFVERIKELIVASGYKIVPSEVESVILEHPYVKEAAVIGVPDPYRGETVKAFVVLKDEYKGKLTEEDITKWCKERMAAYKYPRIVEFVDDLPKSQAQKVLRRVLRERELEKYKGMKNE